MADGSVDVPYQMVHVPRQFTNFAIRVASVGPTTRVTNRLQRPSDQAVIVGGHVAGKRPVRKVSKQVARCSVLCNLLTNSSF